MATTTQHTGAMATTTCRAQGKDTRQGQGAKGGGGNPSYRGRAAPRAMLFTLIMFARWLLGVFRIVAAAPRCDVTPGVVVCNKVEARGGWIGTTWLSSTHSSNFTIPLPPSLPLLFPILPDLSRKIQLSVVWSTEQIRI